MRISGARMGQNFENEATFWKFGKILKQIAKFWRASYPSKLQYKWRACVKCASFPAKNCSRKSVRHFQMAHTRVMRVEAGVMRQSAFSKLFRRTIKSLSRDCCRRPLVIHKNSHDLLNPPVWGNYWPAINQYNAMHQRLCVHLQNICL